MKYSGICFVVLVAFASAGCGDSWKKHDSPTGKFSVMFPGAPKEQNIKGQGNMDVTVYSLERSSWVYLVSHYDFPVAIDLKSAPTKQFLDIEIDGSFRGAQGHKASSKSIKLQEKIDGEEYTGTWNKPRKNMNVRGRTFITSNRMYNIMVMNDAENVDSEAAKKFLDSFQVN